MSTDRRGVIFDMDGTLVDSRLDFQRMRDEMGLMGGIPILEAIDQLPQERAAECRAILHRHEAEGARRATLIAGVRELVVELDRRGFRQAVLTRNSRRFTLATLDRFRLPLDPIISRDDAPMKPDPAAIWAICDAWGVPPRRAVMLGDFRFDIEAGLRAGTRTVLYTAGRPPGQVAGSADADFCLDSFGDTAALLAWLDEVI